MEHIKRVLAIMLVLTMIFSLGETMVFASEVPADTSAEIQSDGTASDDENVIPDATDGEKDVDPGANSGDGGKVTDGEEEDEEVPPPDGEPSAPPSDTETEETEPTATPEPTATAEPTATPEPTPEVPAEPVHKEWPWTEPGNTIDQLMSGGYSLSAGDSSYYVENGGLYLDGTLLVQADARSLNLSDGMLYYAAGNTICRMPAGGGAVETVYTAEGAVKQIYVMGEEIRFLSDGVVYSYDMSWTEDGIAPASVSVPTEEAPPADTEEDAPPADTADETDDGDSGAATVASLPGDGFSLDMNDLGLEPTETETAQPASPLETLEGPADVKKFLPTPYGNLFLTGEVFDYTLSTATAQLCAGVRHCYPDGDWLVVYTTDGDPMQTPLADALNGSVSLQEYSLHQDKYYNVGASDEEIMAQQAEYFASDAYEATLEGRQEYSDNGIMTVSTASSALRKSNLTVSQRNIVLRAQQMSEVEWTAQKSIYAWGGDDSGYVSGKAAKRGDGAYLKDKNGNKSDPDGTFVAGHTYRGIPYSQPVNTNGYVGYSGNTINSFLAAAANPSSKLYSSYSYYSSTAPYYGSDCSAFVSWAWGIGRQVCSTLDTYSTYVGNTITDSLQVGDILNNPRSHVMLVTDIGYDGDGNVVSVEITEETPPKMTVTCYGPKIDDNERYDYVSTKESLEQNYLKSGYTIYHRRSSLPAVTAPEAVQNIGTVATPTMTVTAVKPGEANVTFACATQGATIYYTKNGDLPTDKSTKYDKAITLTVTEANQEANKGRFIFQAIATKSGQATSMPMSAEVNVSVKPTLTLAADGSAAPLSNGIYSVGKDQKLSLKAAIGSTIYYTTDGTDPTVNSDHAVSGAASIDLKTGGDGKMTIKAFSVLAGDIPSEVATFTVKEGTIRTITVDDPFGFLSLENTTLAQDETNKLMESKQYVVDGTQLKIKVTPEVNADAKGTAKYKLASVEWKKGTETKTEKSDCDTFEIKVNADVKITAKVETEFTDLYEKNDTTKSGYAYFTNAVEYGTTKGIVKGYEDKTFRPNDFVTRKEIVTFLGRLAAPSQDVSGKAIAGGEWENVTSQLAKTLGRDLTVRTSYAKDAPSTGVTLEEPGQWLYMKKADTQIVDGAPWYYVQYDQAKGDDGWGWVSSVYSSQAVVQPCPFTDFKLGNEDGYAYGYAQWGYLRGIVSGTYQTSFSPNAIMNREDLCCLLYKYVTECLGVTMDTSNRLDEFVDHNSVRDYAKSAINAMVNAGIINGKSSVEDGVTKYYICPRGTGLDNKDQTAGFATRAEAVTMFMRLDKYLQSVS